jgi:hypothetical protein
MPWRRHSSAGLVPALGLLQNRDDLLFTESSLLHWRNKYGGLEVSELRRLRQLEDENRRLKAIVAYQALDIT